MTRSRLAHLLTSIVTTSIAATSTSCTEPCPYTEVLRTSTVEIGGDVACDLAQKAFGRREVAPSISAADCAATCKDIEVNSCSLDSAFMDAFWNLGSGGAGGGGGGGAGGSASNGGCPTTPTKATLTCKVTETRGSYHDGCPVAGRRPAELESVGAGDGSAGAWLARAAHLEAASVIAFQTLFADLAALGAPADLLASVREAEADEVRHAEAMTRLARAHGAEPPAPNAAPRTPRSIAAIALENAVEGMVRETFGAAVALHQARRAANPEVRAALTAIADDECAHAALSFRVATFLDTMLDARDRALIEDAKRAAIAALEAEITDHAPALAGPLGLPPAAVARHMLARVEAELWQPALAA